MPAEPSTDGTSVSSNGTRAQVTEKALDHGVDAICAVGIVGAVALGDANMGVIGGLVSIALGKRVVSK